MRKRLECPYCNRQGYHIESCRIAVFGKRNNEKEKKIDVLKKWPVKHVPWWQDDVLRKRWAKKDSIAYALKYDPEYFNSRPRLKKQLEKEYLND